jgi:hypothetical protein
MVEALKEKEMFDKITSKNEDNIKAYREKMLIC